MPKRNVSNTTGKEKFERVFDGKNIKKAAEEAGISYQYARRLATKSNIIDKSREYRKKRAEELEISKKDVLREYLSIGMSDIKNYMNPDTEFFKALDKLPDGASRAIESLQIDSYTTTNKSGEITVHDRIKFKLWNKTNALEMLSRYTGGFVEKKEVDANVNINSHEHQIIEVTSKEAKNKLEKLGYGGSVNRIKDLV